MFSLYSNLFRYRESELRSPREDYLSECLADFFNRLPLALQISFAARIFIPEGLLTTFATVVADATSLRLETQRQITSGRIDLVLLAGEVPIVAIENKIAAQVRDDQLASYGRWIRSAAHSRFAVVCFLTHLTLPPHDFMNGGDASGKATPHVAKWPSVGAILAEMAANPGLRDDLRMLARELRSFLEESNMSTEYAGRDDFAAALVYLRAGARMDHTFSSIFAHIKSKEDCFQRNETKNEYSLLFDTPYKLIWGWAFLSHRTFPSIFFGYGIALEPNTIFTGGDIPAQAKIPSADSAFICVGTDERRGIQAIRSAKNEPEKPWTYAEVGRSAVVVSFKPLHDFMKDPQNFAQEMIRWIDQEADAVKTFVKDLK